MILHNAVITGSLTLNGTDIGDITGSEAAINALNIFSSSIYAYTASNDTTNTTQNNRLSSLEITSGSLLTASGSFSTRVTTLETASGSFSTRVTNTETTASNLTVVSSSFSTRVTNNEATGSNLMAASASFSTRTTNLETASGSFSTRVTTNETNISNLQTASGSFSTRVTSAESSIVSLQGATGSYATTGSNNFVNTQRISATNNAIGFTSTASLYTDGGLRVTKDAYVSGTLYLNNLTVYGTQSVQYITASQLNISTNIISVNTDTPSIRYGGLSVYDSGSTGLTGSLLWDSEANHWIYTNPSGSTYSGGMLISGPRASALGSEQGTTACALMMGQGGDHITSSGIFHYGNATCFYGTSTISSTGVYSGTCNVLSSKMVVGGTSGDIASDTLRVKGTIITDNNAGYLGYSSLGSRYELAKISSGDEIVLGTTNSPGAVALVSGTGQDLILRSNGTCERIRVTTTGAVGIGSNAPTTDDGNLVVAGAVGTGQGMTCTTAQINIWETTSGNKAGLWFGAVNCANVGVIGSRTATGNIAFQTYCAGWGERMRITYNGNVGIANTSPSSFLHLGTYASSGKYIDSATLPTAPSNYLITLTPPSTTNYYGGGIAWSEGTCVAAAINVYDDGATGALGLSISTGTNNGLSERVRITSTGVSCFACTVCAPTLISSGGISATGVICSTSNIQSNSQIYALACPPANNGGIFNARDCNANGANTSFAGIFFNSSPGSDYSIGKLTVNTVGYLQVRNGNNGCSFLIFDSVGTSCFACQVCVPMLLASGCVGIGTTSISSTYGTLTVAGTGITIADDGSAKLQIGRYSAAACNAYIKMGTNACSLRFTNAADTVDVVVIEKGGNVGIGTCAPGKILNVAANDSTSGNYQARSAVIRIQNTNDVSANSRFAGVQFSFSPGVSTLDSLVIGAVGAVLTDTSTQWSGDLVFAVKNATTATTLTEYARIFTGGIACFACQVCAPAFVLANGNCITALRSTGGAAIGVFGFAAGSDTLNIKGGNSGGALSIRFEDTANPMGGFYNSNFGIGTLAAAYRIDAFCCSSATNTVTPVLRLAHVTSGTAATGLGAGISFFSQRPSSAVNLERAAIYGISGTNPDDDGDLAFYTRTDTGAIGVSEKMRITSDGNVGVNIVNPNSRLHVLGSTSIQNRYEGSDDGLILHYSFSEQTGNCTVDRSQYGIPATFIGNTTWNSNGIAGGGVYMDGCGDYLTVCAPPSSISMGTNMTYSAWLYVCSFAGKERQYIFDPRGDGNSSGMNSYFLFDCRGSNCVRFTVGNNDIEVISSPSIPFNTGVWNHVAATRCGSTWRIYLNGTEVHSGTTNNTSLAWNNSFRIGTFSNSGSGCDYYFNGVMDEVRMYNRTLSIGEIREQYHKGGLGHYAQAQPNGYSYRALGFTTGTIAAGGSCLVFSCMDRGLYLISVASSVSSDFRYAAFLWVNSSSISVSSVITSNCVSITSSGRALCVVNPYTLETAQMTISTVNLVNSIG